ncbi:MAG: hypothetical protein BV456_01710 [Thermoplasmata archaeon M8B2D]|nr:MAG: hypothetical protein BV456_01710 [Thermoplasmata archaeon M8B2D]
MELFNSVGIELEIENLTPNDLNSPNLGFRIHRDASCESDGFTSNGIKIDVENSTKELLELIPLRKNTFGCELVTAGVLDTSNLDYLYKLKSLTNLLISKGESTKSYRAGFHVHINLSYNIKIIKSVLRLARHLEQVLYLLGGMGYDYRGFKNDSTYCRPITKYGPVCVPTGRGDFSQVFTIAELLGCKDTEEFKMKYGDIARLKGNHYIPIRYHGINLLPLFTQGSLEFRMFNKSLNPYYLMSIIEFCKAFSEYAVHSSFLSLKEENLLKENSVFDVKGEENRQKILDTFSHFLQLSNLRNEQIIDTLYDILSYSSVDSIVLPNKYIFSHLMFHRQGNRCPTHWQNGNYTANVIPKNKISTPNFEDIHVLRERNPDFRIREPQRIMENLNNFIRRPTRTPIRNATNNLTRLVTIINRDYGEIFGGPRRNEHDERYFVVHGNEEYTGDILRIYFDPTNFLIIRSDLGSREDFEEWEEMNRETIEEIVGEELEINDEIPEPEEPQNPEENYHRPTLRFNRWTQTGNFTTTANTTNDTDENRPF